MDELDRKLSRLALAKAIKTPLESESDIDPWNKSVIFNQPFLKDLHKPSEPTKTPGKPSIYITGKYVVYLCVKL